jgi:DHA1 family bicyclomycin/chloramphenicol resistance-like MFS transporter
MRPELDKTMLKRSQIALLAGFGAIAPLSIDMYLPAMPQLAADLGVTSVQAGQSVAIFFCGVAAGQLVAGPMSDRWGRRPLILGGLFLYLLGSMAAMAGGDFALLLASRLTQAMGACAVTVAGRAIVRDRLEATEAARLFSLLALIGGLAPVLAPALGNVVLAVGSWRAIFLIMAIVGAILLIGTIAALPESRSAHSAALARQEHPFHTYAQLLAHPLLRSYLVAGSCNSACMFAYIANSPAVLMDQYGLTPPVFGLAFAINAIGLVGASQLNRRLLSSRGPAMILQGSMRNAFLMALLFAAFAALPWVGLAPLLLLLFCVIASTAIVQANVLAMILGIDPGRTGSAAALFGACTFAAGAASAWTAGALPLPRDTALAVTIAACLVGCGLSLITARRVATP